MAKIIFKYGIINLCVLFLLMLSAFAYSRIRGPIRLPLFLVKRLAGWQAYNKTYWNGKGTVLAYMHPGDLVPRGERVRLLPPFKSAILGCDRALLVYLPEGFKAEGPGAYPVIFALHGFGDRPNSFVHSLLPYLEKAMESGAMPHSVVVMPDFSLSGDGTTPKGYPTDGRAGSWYVNSNMGRFEDHFFREIVPFARKSFKASTDPGKTVLIGSSMGGFGALYYSITHPEFSRHVVSIYPAADLRYSVGGNRLADYNPERYAPITSDDPFRIMMEGGPAGTLGVSEDFFLYPVFGSDVSPGKVWKEDRPVWERLRDVNPADILSEKYADLRGIGYYIFAGDRDEFNFDAHLPRVMTLLRKAGATVEPGKNIIPGMKHGWWQLEYNEHKEGVIRWIGERLSRR